MKIRTVFAFAAVLVTCFIFSNSMQTAESSTKQSDVIVNAVNSAVHAAGRNINRNRLEHVVRKCAHAAEFAVQGLLVAPCLTGELKKRAVGALVLGLITACTDECIQLFSSGRAAMVSDVCIDGFGAAAGIAAALVLIKRKFKREEREGEYK